MTQTFITWFVPLMYVGCFGGMAYVILRAAVAGAEAYADEYTTDTSRQMEDIFLFIPAQRVRQMAWGAAATGFILVFLVAADLGSLTGVIRGVLAGMIGAVAAFFAPRWGVQILKKRRLMRFNEQLVDALINMSNALKAGFSITQAFEAVVKEGHNPIAQEFAVFLQQLRVGVRFDEAMVNMEKRVNSEDLSLMIRAVEVARITGGNLTEVFESIARTIRERMRIEGRIRSLTAQGRLQGVIVSLMPVFLAIAISVIEPEMMRAFIRSWPGAIVILTVVMMDVAGWLVIRKIIRIDV